jgi:AraC family transcriptional regulator, regulatory protein of adaptative response / methylated-DNA-[protein]-cysteine methyltransferase
MSFIIEDPTYQTDTLAQSADAATSEVIAYAVGESTLGKVLVARSAEGVCAILMGSQVEELMSDLAALFPSSDVVRNDRRLNGDLQKVLCFIETPAEGLDLPLVIQATPFQRRVWDVVLKVPAGAIITYGALAARIGEPTAVRAVANACAANAIALAIPCHRVIRKDGTFSGYRWGEERKRALIAR